MHSEIARNKTAGNSASTPTSARNKGFQHVAEPVSHWMKFGADLGADRRYCPRQRSRPLFMLPV
jgi:hypothetical protein